MTDLLKITADLPQQVPICFLFHAASASSLSDTDIKTTEDESLNQEKQGESAKDPFPVWGKISIGASAGLVLLAVFFAALKLFWKPKKQGKKPDPVLSNEILVEKLHEQGARKNQQDSFSVSQEELFQTHGLLAVVADGMGGLSDGDKTSQTAVAAMMNGFYMADGRPENVLLSLLKQANDAVNAFLGTERLRSSGSTLVAGLIRDGAFYYLSVGDSRIYLYREHTLYQLNREHNYRYELYLDAINGRGSLKTAAEHPKGSGLTSFLGMGQLKYIDLPDQPIAVRPNDIFLLMSDGVYNALSEAELAAALNSKEGIADALRAAIQAKAYKNQDNYTAVILQCR